MIGIIRRYTRWPAGTVENLPVVKPDGTTTVPGVRIVGDLTGVPLLKFSSDSGARAVHALLAEPDFGRGGDSALETAIALAGCGSEVTLSYRKKEFSRPKPDNLERLSRNLIMFVLFGLFCAFLFNWKAGGELNRWFREHEYFPYNIPALLERSGQAFDSAFADPATLPGTLAVSLGTPGFYYALTYSVLVAVFGIVRVGRRPTPYIRRQKWVLALIQVFPLFLLPQLLLPWAGYNGFFDDGIAAYVADNLFPATAAGHGREYWRAYGLILAWPLFIWNVFTAQPLWWWLAISLVQTFVLIPGIIFFWGKGAYCGWICS